MLVAGCQQFGCFEVEVLVKQNCAIFYVVDIGTYLIHAVGRCDSHYIVTTRITEYTIS